MVILRYNQTSNKTVEITLTGIQGLKNPVFMRICDNCGVSKQAIPPNENGEILLPLNSDWRCDFCRSNPGLPIDLIYGDAPKQTFRKWRNHLKRHENT